jgi:hypothetical protein
VLPHCHAASRSVRRCGAIIGSVRIRPLNLLREALGNLAADASVQRQRLAGAVIPDELALDFDGVFSAAISPTADIVLNDFALQLLHELQRRLSVAPSASLWTEDLDSPDWTAIRTLATQALIEL